MQLTWHEHQVFALVITCPYRFCASNGDHATHSSVASFPLEDQVVASVNNELEAEECMKHEEL